jgi:outer membrane protein TolC
MKPFLLQLLSLTSIVTVFVCIVPRVSATDPFTWMPQPLAELIEEGLTNNQEIKSLESMVKSSKEGVSYAGALEDLRIGIGLLNLPTDSFRFDQEPMTQKQLFIAQKIPWFGKLDLRSQDSAIKALRQEAILNAKRVELARQIATAYYELGFVSSSQKINDRLIRILNQLLRVSETRYSTGVGLQHDVLQAQVEISKLLDEQITLEKRSRTLEDRINALLNRKDFIAVTPPDHLPYPDSVFEIKKLQDYALSMNPWLKVKQAEVDQAKVEIELAQKDYWPDMDFKVGYGQRDDLENGQNSPDFVSASVVLNIPLWQKARQNKKLEANKSLHQAALKAYQNLANRLPFKIDALVTDIRKTQKNYKLIVDALLVQAEQWARSSMVAYEVGKVNFNTTVTAQINLLRFELQSENYLFSLYKKHAELEEVLGAPPLPKDLSDNGPYSQMEKTS